MVRAGIEKRRISTVASGRRTESPCALLEGSALARRGPVRHKCCMTDSAETRAPILAAGGIVLREGSKPRIAIVRLRRDKSWVLPKGKLCQGERPLAGARREVMEETGHKVSVREFLGSMSYAIDGRIKIVQFWHMRAIGGAAREPTNEIRAVRWLSLKEAINMLSRTHEKVFLAHVGPIAIKSAKSTREKTKRRVAKQIDQRSRRTSDLFAEQSLVAG